MTDVHSACIDVCSTSAIAQHRAHQARLKRIAARAVIPSPPPEPQQPPPQDFVPDETTVASDFCCAEWFRRQEQPNPIPTLEGETAPIAPLSIRKIQKACAEHYGVSVTNIVSARRMKEIVRPRMVAMYLSKEMMTLSLPAIGRQFGDRDHSTVLHSIRKIVRLSQTDAQLAAEVETIRAAVLA